MTLVAATTLLAVNCLAQAPSTPQGLTYVNSTVFPGASISLKETTICETNKGVRGWSGYVNLPPVPWEGQNYEVHTWFWFFEARDDPANAPLSLWLQGGPGAPTSVSAVNENGPCVLLNNSRESANNPWSWNDRVNMLYIDQPVQTGFSYDTLIQGVVNEVLSPFAVFPGADQTTNETALAGVFSSQNPRLAPNSSDAVAPAMWRFMQTWLQDFPGYRGDKHKFSIWGESYGGHWVPTFADYFYSQNARIEAGELNGTSLAIDSIGLINACIDAETQMPMYPVMAANNTYGIKIFNDTAYAASMAALPQCLNYTRQCRELAASLDSSQSSGSDTEVNSACGKAYGYCFNHVARETGLGGLQDYDAFHFDIASPLIHSFPPRWAAGYLNNATVQEDLGVPLNFTGFSATIAGEFEAAGDFLKGDNLAILGQLLDRGVKVALMYGDRDYQCNCECAPSAVFNPAELTYHAGFGGEAISLAINSSTSADFEKAGYTNFATNASYNGGLTRQYGNLSFTRVFQAGHEVSYYQPETSYEIFNRVIFDRDIPTGQTSTAASDSSSPYATTGNSSALVSIGAPIKFESDVVSCYLWDIMETCTLTQTALFKNGSAITEDFVLVGYERADGSRVFFNESAVGGNGTNNGNGSSPVPYRPSNGASHGPARDLWLVALAVAAVTALL
ncbi:alpha/beta-hydrolase [Aureobasidium pullulans]|nr:alpha/beta-hydrolase [Aureobasidium pullulans]THZ92209.1 alpha/beta-hydrolase [Aureobasidium pullulans]